MSYSLFKSFVYGMLDYIAQHNANYTTIETALNQLAGMINGQAGVNAVPDGLEEIFDRRGLIGIGSYDFSAGASTSIVVAAGAYYYPGFFYHKATQTTLSLVGRGAGTYYVNLDSAGTPFIGTAADTTTTRQFYWNGTTTTSAKAVYAGVNTLFDGDDYADMLTSAARAKTFTKVADRLEEIEVLLGKTVQTPASADTINVNWALGGVVRVTLDRATTTFNFSGAYDGQRCVLELLQDGVGGRGIAFGAEAAAGIDFTFPVPLSVDPDKTDYVGFIYNLGRTKYDYVSLARGY
jgi:hypothetical protein